MKFDKAQYLREVFANKMKAHTGRVRKVRMLKDGVYMESKRPDGLWDRGVVPQEFINQWAVDMWGE